MPNLNREKFINYLKENYYYLFELVIWNDLTLCVPETEVNYMSKDFIEAHILDKCLENNRYTSLSGIIYEREENTLTEIDEKNCIVEIISSYLVCEEHQNFNIYILNKPLVIEQKVALEEIDNLKIEQQEDATEFLKKYNKIGPRLFQDIELLNITIDINSSDIVTLIQDVIKEKWSILLRLQIEKLQTNRNFQYLLTLALENVISEKLYDKIMYVLHKDFELLDFHMLEKCKTLSNLNVTPDQFGVPDDFVIPLPAAIVELATLDLLRSPIEKLYCLQTTYDFILAELKAAIVDTIAEISDLKIPAITNEIITGFLMYVIAKSKPMHLMSNFYFINNFQCTLPPNSDVSCILNAFHTAISKLQQLSIEELRPRSPKVYSTLSLENLIHITGEINDRFDRNGRRTNCTLSPTEIHLERLTSMIALATSKDG